MLSIPLGTHRVVHFDKEPESVYTLRLSTVVLRKIHRQLAREQDQALIIALHDCRSVPRET
jgi:hypothetical protein